MKKTIAFVWVILIVVSGCSGSGNDNVASNITAQQSAATQPTTAPDSPPSQQRTLETGDVEIIATRANLRAMPNASSDVVMELAQGDQLQLQQDGSVGAWYNVRDLASGKTGWIHGNSIKITSTAKVVKPATPPENEPSKAESTESQKESARTKKGSNSGGDSDTYTNKDGIKVPRPRHSTTVPAGASARCRDGTYSFSLNRRGTCSHHGGVAQWL